MKKLLPALLIVMLAFTPVFATACNQNNDESREAFSDDHKIPYGNVWENEYYKKDENGNVIQEGAASVERDGDVKDSPYFKVLDFYTMKSTETLTLLEGYKTIQQATEWTCGPTAALTVLEWYGKRNGLNEMDLYVLRNKPTPGATNLRQMIHIFEGLNTNLETSDADYRWEIYSTYDLAEVDLDATEKQSVPEIEENMLLNNLKAGIPTIIGWDDWGGHWTVVIGYDTMGTETTADDILVVADPYDTTDHCQDGYVIQSFERLYYNWKNGFDKIFSRNVFLTVKTTPAA